MSNPNHKSLPLSTDGILSIIEEIEDTTALSTDGVLLSGVGPEQNPVFISVESNNVILVQQKPPIATSVVPPNSLETTGIKGILQSDVLIRAALVFGINQLRVNPILLDYCFAWLAQDDLTSNEYGEKTIEQAKKWFLNNNIPIVMANRLDEPKFPCVSITLIESNEEKNTLGDVNYVAAESSKGNVWPILVGPFTPHEYDIAKGIITLPPSLTNNLILGEQMVVVTRDSKVFDILDMPSDNSIRIKSGVNLSFDNCTLRSRREAFVTSVKSAVFRETYSLGCHTLGEQEHLIFLHSIVTFVLLMFRQSLLEDRGFDVSAIKSSDLKKNPVFDRENVFTRTISITGLVRNYWPNVSTQKIARLLAQMSIDKSGQLYDSRTDPDLPGNEKDTDIMSAIGDLDPLSIIFKVNS